MKYFALLLLMVCFIVTCQNRQEQACNDTEGTSQVEKKKRRFPRSVDHDKFFEKDGRKYLYGGDQEHMHFDITGYTLVDSQFNFGIGRERFPALLEPEFISVTAADSIYADSSRFLLLNMNNTIKAYSIKDLTRHEVVNDMIEGRPVMAAYCILADLGAVYDRELGNRHFTFGLSGYTYADEEVWDGMNGFVMWDRETESLWWPLIGEAVSGPMKGTKMKVLDESFWSQTNWKEIRKHYPQALVLRSGQDFDRPENWPGYENIDPVKESANSIAPRWGENSN